MARANTAPLDRGLATVQYGKVSRHEFQCKDNGERVALAVEVWNIYYELAPRLPHVTGHGPDPLAPNKRPNI